MALGSIRAELAALARGNDPEATFLRDAFGELRRQVERAKSVDELRLLDASFRQLVELGEARAQAIAAVKVARGEPVVVAGRRREPDRRALLDELARVGSKEPPAAVLMRLGLVEADPLPTGHGRWRGTRPDTRGAVVFDGDDWHDLAVQAILAAARAETDPGPAPRLTLIAGRSA